jgi:hypothetical protein
VGHSLSANCEAMEELTCNETVTRKSISHCRKDYLPGSTPFLRTVLKRRITFDPERQLYVASKAVDKFF